MYQDLIIILGIIFLIYKLITHEGKLSMARVIATFSIIVGCGLVLLSKLISPFVLLFWWLICIGISLIGMYFVPSSENYDEDKTDQQGAFTVRLFGTDGVRGEANTELTPELAYHLGRAATLYFGARANMRPRILIGRDTRISGESAM